MNSNTERYLRRNGVSEEVLSDLRAGLDVRITGDGLTSWLKGAWKDGEKRTRRSLAEALLPMIERYAEIAAAQAVAEMHVDMHKQVMDAEANSDRLGERLHKLKAIEANARAFQAIVADCQCWFDGFKAAHAGQESWDKPWTPSRDSLSQLNMALQALLPGADEEVPF